MDLIGAEPTELFALEFAKIAESDCLHSSMYKCRPMSTKHGHNMYDNEIERTHSKKGKTSDYTHFVTPINQ